MRPRRRARLRASRCAATATCSWTAPATTWSRVAGQVASGCNLITSHRQRLHHQLPVRADDQDRHHHEALRPALTTRWTSTPAAYLTGMPMDAARAPRPSSRPSPPPPARRPVGERAGHSQVSIWRDWRQTGPRSRCRCALQFTADDHDTETDGVAAGRRTPDAAGRPAHAACRCTRRRPTRAGAARRWCCPPASAPGRSRCGSPTRLPRGDWTRGARDARPSRCRTPRAAASRSGPAENTYARMMTSYLAHPQRRAGAAAGARLREDAQRLLPLPAGRGGAGPVAVRLGQHPARRRHRGDHRAGARLVREHAADDAGTAAGRRRTRRPHRRARRPRTADAPAPPGRWPRSAAGWSARAAACCSPPRARCWRSRRSASTRSGLPTTCPSRSPTASAPPAPAGT